MTHRRVSSLLGVKERADSPRDCSGLGHALGQWFENQFRGLLGPFPDLPKHCKPGVREFSGPQVTLEIYQLYCYIIHIP